MAESITELKTELSLAVAYLIINNDTTVTFDMELPEKYIGKVVYAKVEEGNRGAAIKTVVSN